LDSVHAQPSFAADEDTMLCEQATPLLDEANAPVFDTFDGQDCLPMVAGHELCESSHDQDVSSAHPPCLQSSHQLPEMDENAVVILVANDPHKGGEHNQSAWSARTQKMHATLASAFDDSHGAGLSYSAMIAKTRSKLKRRVAAGCFQELLFLSSHGLLKLKQRKPYGDIEIKRTTAFVRIPLAI